MSRSYRRPFYGGGTAFYGEGCAATWAFLLPKAAGGNAEVADAGESLDDRLARYQPVVLDFLARLGLSEVQFEGSSDLRINGRKLGALTAQDIVACDCVGGFINLSEPDLDLYLSIARVPDEKFKDKIVKDLREYVITAEEIRRDIQSATRTSVTQFSVRSTLQGSPMRGHRSPKRSGLGSVGVQPRLLPTTGSSAYLPNGSLHRRPTVRIWDSPTTRAGSSAVQESPSTTDQYDRRRHDRRRHARRSSRRHRQGRCSVGQRTLQTSPMSGRASPRCSRDQTSIRPTLSWVSRQTICSQR